MVDQAAKKARAEKAEADRKAFEEEQRLLWEQRNAETRARMAEPPYNPPDIKTMKADAPAGGYVTRDVKPVAHVTHPPTVTHVAPAPAPVATPAPRPAPHAAPPRAPASKK